MHVLCPSCKSTNAIFFDEYLYNRDEDKKLLGASSIYECSECSLLFADPMPDFETLVKFYEERYRAKGRPHYSAYPPKPGFRQMSYLAYLTMSVDMNTVHNVLEVGAGWGEFGQILTERFPWIKLHTVEPDLVVRETLEARGYSIISDTESAQNQWDVVLSFHSLEHFSDVDSFFSMFPNIRPGGFAMVEVPDCDPSSEWKQRVYDSPHLLFFSRQSLDRAFRARQFTRVQMHLAGHSKAERLIMERAALSRHGQSKSVYLSMRSTILSSLPSRIQATLMTLFGKNRESSTIRSARYFDFSQDSGWAVRGVFQKSQ